MTTTTEAMKMMVEALESIRDGNTVIGQKESALAAGRAAIEAAEKVGPVAEKVAKRLASSNVELRGDEAGRPKASLSNAGFGVSADPEKGDRT